MDQLSEPLEINRKFIKMIEQDIQPKYDKKLNELWKLVKHELDKKYLKKTS